MGDNSDPLSSSSTSNDKLWDSEPESELAGNSGQFRSVQQTLMGVQASEAPPGSLAAEAQQFVTEQRISEAPQPPPPGLRFVPKRYRTIPPGGAGAQPPRPAAATSSPAAAPGEAPDIPATAPAEASAPPAGSPALAIPRPNVPPHLEGTPAPSLLTSEQRELGATSAEAETDTATGGASVAETEGESAEPAAAEAAGDSAPTGPSLAEAPEDRVASAPAEPAEGVSVAASAEPSFPEPESPPVVAPAETTGAPVPEAVKIAASRLGAPSNNKARKGLAALFIAGAVGGLAVLATRSGPDPAPSATIAEPPPKATAALQPEPAEPPPTLKEEVVLEKPALPPLALRPEQSLKTCDKLLGKPFKQRAHARRAMANSVWKQALKSLMRGRMEEAQKLLCYACTWDIGGPATYGLAEHLMKAGDYAQALSYARMVPESEKNQWRKAQDLIGDIHAQRAELEPAKQAWLGLANVDANDKDAVTEAAAKYVKSGKAALSKKSRWVSERIFRRAVILDPDNADAAAGLATALRRQKLTEAAFQWVTFAVEKNNSSAFVQLELLEQLVARKEFDAAQEALVTAKQLAPKHPRLALLARRVEKGKK